MDKIPENFEDIDKIIEEPSDKIREIFSYERVYNKYIIGSILRVFNVDGVTFVSTHKKIKFDKSKFFSDKTFKELFFESQDCFNSPEDMIVFPNTVHIFMISSDCVNTDSRQEMESDRVFYITSFVIEDNLSYFSNEMENTMIQRIENLNKMASKKILFPKLLTEEEVNSTLNPYEVELEKTTIGLTNREINDKIDNLDTVESLKKFFQPGEKVIMRSENGYINTIIPSSALRRSIMSDGKTDVRKIFYDCIGFFIDGSLRDNKIFLRHGYKRETLLEIKELIDRGQKVDFERFPPENCSFLELVVTNLFFSVPLSRIDRVFELIQEYEEDSVENFDFILSRSQDIRFFLENKKFQNYPGMHNRKKLVEYFILNFRRKHNNVVSESWWPAKIKERLRDQNLKIGMHGINKQAKQKLIESNSLMHFVYNTEGLLFLTMMNFKKIVLSCEAAWERTNNAKQV